MRWAMPCCWLLGLSSWAMAQSPHDSSKPWTPIYENGRWAAGVQAWSGEGTNSRRTPDGLLVADTSTHNGSGRFYHLKWNAGPRQGAAVEARVKVASCSQAWGVALMVADGVHEEGLTLYPNRLQLENAKRSFDFDAAKDFHTYRMEIQGTDLRLIVDTKLLAQVKFTTRAQGGPPRNQCGFGCGASAATGEAIWQWVRCQANLPSPPSPKISEIPGLKASLGETVEIVPNAIYTSLFQFRDGRLAVGDRHSRDGGKTWTKGPRLHTGAFEFADGEVISPGFNTKKLADGVFQVPMARSSDGGKTFRAEQARLNIPEATGGTGDDGKHYEGPCVDHAIVQARDGSLLMAMYGYFKTDTVLCPAFPPEWKLYKYRTWVVRSTDRGRTWDFWATVAYDPKIGSESFCEADLHTLANGDILCFMRTGGSPPKFVAPLYVNLSTDDGKTWTKPQPIADRGVWPSVCRMQSGVLVATYGRPDNWLAFSRDNGKTWLGHFSFYQGPTTSYNSLAEVSPGKLLVVYDRSGLDADGNQSRATVGTFVTVNAQ